jgi:hypothetical protein
MSTGRCLAVLVAAALTSAAMSVRADEPPPPLAQAAPAPPPPPVALEPRNPTLMIGGIVIAAVGGAALHVAAILPVLQDTGNCAGSGCPSDRNAVGAMFLGGLVAIAVGIPLMVVGGKHVPVHTAWMGAPGSKGWAWSF